MDISKNIKRIRIKKGLTQLQAARLCGMLEPQYRRYENGKSNPRASTVERIAADNYCGKCGTPLDWENMEDVDAADV